MSKSKPKKMVKKSDGNLLKRVIKEGDIWTKVSMLIMGTANLRRRQIVKGLLFLLCEAAFIFYMAVNGVNALSHMATLGTQTQGWVYDENLGIDVLAQGDNSMLLLLYGVVCLFVIVLFVLSWRANLKSALEVQKLEKEGKKIPGFKDDVKVYLDAKFNRTMLTLPMIGVMAFTVLPLVYMILVAFTNYDNAHQPPGNLFTWIGLDNFVTILGSGSTISKTFWPILGWTITWAVFATVLNYIGGILLALLINRKGVKFKGFWRTIFVLSIAIPSFVSLLIMKTMLQPDGAVNVLLKSWGVIQESIPFLTNATLAKVTIIVVNLWIGIPYTMLITSGILMNIPADLYEAARVDGANARVMFRKITMPYVLFVTTPYLITQFIGNINNFNVIYLLSQGGPSTLDYYQAGKTDLLVTWLYKLTVTSKDYCYASAIGILVFVISAVFSLITYRRTSAYNNEEAFQ
ncbi:sugar ABC transporter permease [Faecalicatena sp. AGMB00832]|uniref:Maltose/maltodextrin transport system permease protein n=1 Tax=Faecalicatena faecalis TaxID=2726362 RepID=A0ABS6D8D6_9FIRM|nr:sugar ABC transporter permease [Faecalicatena faecalis]MBU3877701.1 sugar ABC transporter permease [Faecalicatena faecalis]